LRKEDPEREFKEVVNGYTDKNINRALQHLVIEVTFKCKFYYLLDEPVLDELIERI
jgi:hypothetical protein